MNGIRVDLAHESRIFGLPGTTLVDARASDPARIRGVARIRGSGGAREGLERSEARIRASEVLPSLGIKPEFPN